MEGIILAALLEGAKLIGKGVMSESVKDLYQQIKKKLTDKFSGDAVAEMALQQVEQKPENWEGILRDALAKIDTSREQDLLTLARQLLEHVGDTNIGVYIQNYYAGDSINESDTDAMKNAYLSRLLRYIHSVPLSGVDPRVASDEDSSTVELSAVYTALLTEQEQKNSQHEMGWIRSDERQTRISAVEAADKEKYLVLLGDPGSGKSTFVNYMALCMAGEQLGIPQLNLDKLRSPLPFQDEEEKAQRWDHGFLMPVRVILRDFAAQDLNNENEAGDGCLLWNFIVSEMGSLLEPFADHLRKILLEQGGLIMLDGLDEVPESDQKRVMVKNAVTDLAANFPQCRFLVTSRTYAYQKQGWRLDGFNVALLSPFSKKQIFYFIDHWYSHLAAIRGTDSGDAAGRAMLLKNVLQTNERLFEIASRPLLLTLIASLHAWRGGNLPENREELYAEAVDLLLDKWERPKVVKDKKGKPVIQQPSLAEYLRIDKSRMRALLNDIAFEVHRDQKDLSKTADVKQERIIAGLLSITKNPDVKPKRIVEYLADRAGLLLPRGEGVYFFPHRSFQEYLAACHLTDAEFPDDVVALFLKDPNRWRETVLLAGAKAARGAAANLWSLAEALCYKNPPKKMKQEKGLAALLAAQLLIENEALENVADRNATKIEYIRNWLLAILSQSALEAVDRVAAGNALAALGDTRFSREMFYLPREPLLGFIKIEAGTFKMGSDPKTDPNAGDEERPMHPLHLEVYYISRYPVTVAQFLEFANQTDFDFENRPKMNTISSHPVVAVSWYDAIRYCEWLTKELRGCRGCPKEIHDLLDAGWRVTLPSEAQWERAARGREGRIYPWGGEITSEYANFSETGIGTTSSVGCFPLGTTPDGALDLSGNVWEWTRSLWGQDWQKPKYKYPYKIDKREDVTAGSTVLRVLRGGSFSSGAQDLRCAYRLGVSPVDGSGSIGFRVVLSPH